MGSRRVKVSTRKRQYLFDFHRLQRHFSQPVERNSYQVGLV